MYDEMRPRDSASFKSLSGSMRCAATGHLFIQFHGCIEETGVALRKADMFVFCKLKGAGNVFLVLVYTGHETLVNLVTAI